MSNSCLSYGHLWDVLRVHEALPGKLHPSVHVDLSHYFAFFSLNSPAQLVILALLNHCKAEHFTRLISPNDKISSKLIKYLYHTASLLRY